MGEEGEQCCHTSCLLSTELPRNPREKKKKTHKQTNPTLQNNDLKIYIYKT